MHEKRELSEFLEAVINIYDSQQGLCDEIALEKSAIVFFEYYKKNITKNQHFYSDLFLSLGKDEKLYSMVLSVIYKLTMDPRAVYAVEDMLFNCDVDLYWADNVLNQISYIKFTNSNIFKSYEKSRQINQRLLQKYLDEYPIEYPYIPYEDRNCNRILVETNTLLGPHHAPSRIVYEFCKSMQLEYGYEVFLVVNKSIANVCDILQCWYEPVGFNYNSDLDGEFAVEYEGAIIRGFQYEWNSESLENRNAVLELVNRWKPLCVFHIGGASYRHDIYRNQTTLISMPCNAGYIVSEAQVLFSYMKDDSEYMTEGIKYIQNQGQIMKSVENFGVPKINLKYNYSKTDLGLPEDSFVICIVGNRLDEEMSDEFIQMLENVAMENKKIQFAIIGKCTRSYFSAKLDGRVTYFGYREDMVDVIKTTDLYVNPIRSGGGGAAVFSLCVGVPVVTLKKCDAHSGVGDVFACDNIEDMEGIIMRYINDNDFYDKQVSEANSRYEEMSKTSKGKIFNNLVKEIEEELKIGRLQ